MFRPILPKLTEIRALNRSNLLFCLDVTTINPRQANHKSPRLKLAQGDCRDSYRGFLPINRDPLPTEKRTSSSTSSELLFNLGFLLTWFSEPSSDLRPPALGCISSYFFFSCKERREVLSV